MSPPGERAAGGALRLIDGPAGRIEWVLDAPAAAARGLAVVCHPHPLYGGSLDNKVASTLARALAGQGWLAVRPNFRGVGASEGVHDAGMGETADLLFLVDALPRLPELSARLPAAAPLALAGFSFGSFVAARAAQELSRAGRPPAQLLLVGAAAGKWAMPTVPPETLVIHGELDETIPLVDVLHWARGSEVPVVVIPQADHFFHRRLTVVKRLVTRHLASADASAA